MATNVPGDSASRRGFEWAATDRANAFLSAVYGWMGIGLVITAVTAEWVAASPAVEGAILSNRALFWGLLIAQLGIVFVLSGSVQRLTAATASLMFVVYAALTGATLSVVLLAFTGESVATTFLVTAGMFGALATYGTITKRSLSGLGQFLFMGLVGLVLASVVAIFWHNDAFQFILSFIGILIFSGLAVYDAQRLKLMAPAGTSGQSASAIAGALSLYLDFTNLFLFLLRFIGNRRDS